jgi:hypothetical protein
MNMPEPDQPEDERPDAEESDGDPFDAIEHQPLRAPLPSPAMDAVLRSVMRNSRISDAVVRMNRELMRSLPSTAVLDQLAKTWQRNGQLYETVGRLGREMAWRNNLLSQSLLPNSTLADLSAQVNETLRRSGPLREAIERLNRTLNPTWLEQPRKLAETISRDFSSTVENISPLVEAWQEQLRAPNWDRMPPLAAIQPIVLDEGIPLVWVPRSEIVMELAEADGAATHDQVLLTRSPEIAEDCATVLKDVTEPRLQDLTDLANVAVRALADGHSEPAQALAGNVFDSFLHDACRRGVMLAIDAKNKFPYKAGRKVMEVLGPDATAADFLNRCVMSPIYAALEEFFPGQPPLTQYSGMPPRTRPTGSSTPRATPSSRSWSWCRCCGRRKSPAGRAQQ